MQTIAPLNVPKKKDADPKDWFSELSSARSIHRKWVKEIFEGKHGRGELYFTGRRARRLMVIEDPSMDKDMRVKRIREGRVVLDVYGETDKLFSLAELSHENWVYVFDDIGSYFRFVEVGILESGTTSEEIDVFWSNINKELPEGSLTLSSLPTLFPEGYLIPLSAGKKFQVAAYSNASTCLTYFGYVLPTGRIAIVAELESNSSDRKKFYGVTDDLGWQPRIRSVKDGLKLAEKGLASPTPEENVFLENFFGELWERIGKAELERPARRKGK